MADLLEEFQIAGKGKVRVEVVDPRQHPELEEEAARKFGIKAVPFQVSDKYQASLVNSYFDLVIQYGDKFETLNFQDLIEVKLRGDADVDVKLRNPEYDITRSIKKVLYGFQNIDDLFASIPEPVSFVGFISSRDQLPDGLKELRDNLVSVLGELQEQAGGKLQVSISDPQEGDGALAAQIAEDYGFQPMAAGLLDPARFYFYMTLQSSDKVVQVALPDGLEKERLRASIEAGLKRFSAGFLKTVGLITPPIEQPNPMMMQMGMAPRGKQFTMLQQKLSESYNVKTVNLSSGIIPEDVDLLAILAPKELNEKAAFAIDQFLMKGGTIIVASSPFEISRGREALTAVENKSGIEDLLKHHGVSISKTFVMDPQNEKYPVPVQRDLGGFAVQDLVMVEYPLFVDIRSEGIIEDDAPTTGISQVTMNWSSPITLVDDSAQKVSARPFLKSTAKSWQTENTNVQPDFQAYGPLGFPEKDAEGPFNLAAVVEGSFTSFFADKENPMLAEEAPKINPETGEEQKLADKKPVLSSIVKKSPGSSRIIVFSSNEFVEDNTLQTSAAKQTNQYLHSLQLFENSVDWSLEDRGLLTIRSRGTFSRTLEPLSESSQKFLEYLNYVLALLGALIVFYGINGFFKLRIRNLEQEVLSA